jgi:hypothetical protein
MFNKKILCLGTNSQDTDTQTSVLAQSNETVNYGLISDAAIIPTNPGYYHTSIIDVSSGGIIQLAKSFDIIILLDQPMSVWTHWKLLLSTYKVMMELDKQGSNVEYKNNANIQTLELFNNMVTKNKSFCIYPWILLTEDKGYVSLCTRSGQKVTTIQELKDWRTNTEYKKVRTAMLKGDRLTNCSHCYGYEDRGIESSRQFETMDWISKLDIKSIEDLDKIEQPQYYEIRLSNKCNLMCRSCKPEHSHLIDKEFKTFNITYPGSQSWAYSNFDYVDISTLNPNTRIYLTGGEPTVMEEFYDFMQKCIDQGQTDFDFAVGTNAAKLSNKFLALSEHFPRMNFSVSLDGYGKINDYQRWNSEFDTVIKNAHLLESRGQTVSFLIVPGMYNVTNLHLLLEYLDIEFPHAGLYLQVNHFSFQSAFNHPNTEMVLDSLERCKKTRSYYSDGRSAKSTIDSLFDHYSSDQKFSSHTLRAFFEYNDKLDQARGVRLVDYIPELEACRKFI